MHRSGAATAALMLVMTLGACGQHPGVHLGSTSLPTECMGDAAHCRVLTVVDGINVYDNLGPEGFCPPEAPCTRPSGPYGPRWQCTELFNRYFALRSGTTPLSGDAKDLFANATNTPDLDVHANGGPVRPEPGDAVIFGNATEGHVAIVTAVGTRWVQVVEQNVPGDGTGRYEYEPATNTVRPPDGSDAHAIGWIRATPDDEPNVDIRARSQPAAP